MNKKILITEAQLNSIVEMLGDAEKETLSESIIDKFKGALRSGLVTAVVVAGLLNSPAISAQDKQEIKSLATQSGIDSTSSETNKTFNNVMSMGVSRGMDKTIARKKAINDAIGKVGENNKNVIGDGDYTTSDLKIIDEQVEQDENGIFTYTVKCTMTITYIRN